ncbi:MAG: transcription elongation factor GreA [Oscillospiraceae bacterium]|nr:transcription elongation factor GreA [Oscillospiraceae bacterium]
MARTYRMSAEKYEELKAELSYLKSQRVDEVSQQLKEARAFGDLSENSEYDEARNEQGKLYSRMSELEIILANYEIVSEDEHTADTVAIGSTVTVDYGDGDTETFKIVGSVEADPMNGRLSDESLIGKALMGRRMGDEISYHAPMGLITCRITNIE